MRVKCFLVTAVLFFFANTGVSFAGTLALDSGKVSSVTLSANSAKVKRVLYFEPSSLKEGLADVIIENISGSADIDSLQIGCFGSLVAAVEEIEKSTYLTQKPANLEKQIKDLEGQIEIFKNKLVSILVKKDIFSNFAFVLGEDISSEILKKQLNTVSEQLVGILQEKEVIDKKIKELVAEKEMLVKQRELFISTHTRYKLLVKLNVEKVNTGQAGFNIIYNDSNAGFVMEYDICALPELKEIEVITKACVWQNTFEKWEDVSVSVATALEKSIWVGILNEKTNISNDNIIKKYPLNSTVFPSDFFYSVDLNKAKNVKFVAQFLNTTDMPYIEGKADIFYSGMYKGVITMPEVVPQSLVRVEIDKASGVLVSHRQTGERFQEEGILKIKRQIVKDYEIFFKAVSRDYAYDMLEISLLTENVEADITDISVTPFSLNKLKGKVLWMVDLSKDNKLITYKTIYTADNSKKQKEF